MQLGPEGEFERKRLIRLLELQGGDAGFFLLATHSYIESWLRGKYHLWENDSSFGDLIFKFKIDLIGNTHSFPREMSVLQTLRAKEKTASAVLHHFVEISAEEASAASYRLLQFCSLAGIDFEDQMNQLRLNLKSWEDRSSCGGGSQELIVLRDKLTESREHNKRILEEVDQLRGFRMEAENYSRKISLLESELRLLKSGKDESSTETVELNVKKERAEDDKTQAQSRIDELVDAKEYLGGLCRLSSYTRTRFDFERDITRLTAEQQKVLDGISLTDDFLVKGGAGTGKTLVLIKALEKALETDKAELSFTDEKTSVRLLTYNRTLAKYDKYLAEVLDQEKDAEMISTVDKYLYDKLRMIEENYRIVYADSYAVELAAEHNKDGLFDDEALAYEIENIIFAGDLSEDEYLRKSIKDREQREQVWKIMTFMIMQMNKNSMFTKNYSRKVILDYLKTRPDDGVRDTDFIFIDEVQDLAPVDIKTVKACSRRAVIMAGDSDQSIYQSGFSFARGGVDIRGNTRILRTNFRNTIEIHSLAEAYRFKSADTDSETQPEAFRNGPPPELYMGEDKDELISLMMKRVRLFTGDLSYDPENICILVPSSKDIEPIQSRLSDDGYESHDLRSDDFSFKERNVLRISTMHSSKGLDFPIVLLFLHKLPRTSAAGNIAAGEKRRRNLIYVSMTRAMDHLNVFMLEGEIEPEIADLAEVFNSTRP